MRLTSRLLVASFLLFIAITATMAVLGQSIRDLGDTSVASTATAREIAVSNALQQALTDVETGQRGYFVTRDAAYLEPWDSGRRDTRRLGQRLREVTHTRDGKREAAALDDAVRGYLREYAVPTVELARSGASTSELTRRMPDGRDRVADIRAAFADFQEPREAEVRENDARSLRAAEDARTLARVLWLALAALLAAIAVYIARSVGRPIDRVREGVERVADGDLHVRVDGGGLPETRALADAFNAMAAELEEQRAALDTQRREIEEHARALERSNADLDQFAYAAAHDLQEPLRTVASYTELLARRYRGKLDDDADEFIEFAVDGARRMQTLIRDLLSYSRVSTRASEPVPVALGDIVDDVERSLSVQREESSATIERSSLPTVLGDRSQLEMLLQNLVGNAIKFRGAQAPVIRVEHAPSDEPGRIEVRVVDNGIGVAPEYAERVFRLFQRLNHRSKYDGTGIGLTLCKRIVERHGGSIWIEQPPEGGTAFAFTLPIGANQP